MDLLKEKNPQKALIKNICKIMYYLGVGDCWYEKSYQTKLQRLCYRGWMGISNFYTFSFIINEYVAYFRSDLNDKEKNDLVQFTLAHSTIAGKIVCAYLKKKQISKVLARLLERSGSDYVSPVLDRACVKHSLKIGVTLLVITYITLLGSTFDGVRAYYDEGVPIRTEVTFYPPTSSSGIAVNILRFFIHLHWWFIVTIMLSVDCLCIFSLVVVGYKFKLLQVYFSSLRQKVLEGVGNLSKEELGEEFRRNFIFGIRMHDDALWCAKNVQVALGILYSVQVFECVVLLVMCLIKLVTVERNLVFLLANFLYIVCLIILTGAYMMPAGDITYEASLVSTSMFHSGWELVTCDLRVLAVLALQRSQVPVYMSAFRILTLSYSSLISVIRSSYSFFAVMY